MFDDALPIIRDALPEIGTLRRVTAEFTQYSSRYDRVRAGEPHINAFDPALCNAAILDMGCYPIHALISMFGEPAHVSAEAYHLESGFEAGGIALLRYDGFVCEAIWSKVCKQAAPTTFMGEDGSILLDDINHIRRIWLVRRSGETVELPYREKLPNNMMYELREFAGYIASGTQPEKRNRNSILTAAVIEEARRQTGTHENGCDLRAGESALRQESAARVALHESKPRAHRHAVGCPAGDLRSVCERQLSLRCHAGTGGIPRQHHGHLFPRERFLGPEGSIVIACNNAAVRRPCKIRRIRRRQINIRKARRTVCRVERMDTRESGKIGGKFRPGNECVGLPLARVRQRHPAIVQTGLHGSVAPMRLDLALVERLLPDGVGRQIDAVVLCRVINRRRLGRYAAPQQQVLHGDEFIALGHQIVDCGERAVHTGFVNIMDQNDRAVENAGLNIAADCLRVAVFPVLRVN